MSKGSNENRGFKIASPENPFGRVAPPMQQAVTSGEPPVINRDLRKAPPAWWHPLLHDAFKARYQLQGRSMDLWEHDWALLRRTCGQRHPGEITVQDMETQILRVKAQSTRATYVIRYKSIWRTLRQMGVIAPECQPDALLPNIRKPRGVPRPVSVADAELLLSTAAKPREREWFHFALLGGLRAMEVAAIAGSWLEQDMDGYSLRIYGKGNTELAIPCHPKLVEIIQSHRTLGPLYGLTNGAVSDLANKEMKRLGVVGTFHGLRHTYATLLLAKSNDLLLVAECLRHANLQTTRGYAQLQQGRKRVFVDQLFAGGSEVHDASKPVA